MATVEKPAPIPVEDMADLQEAIENAMKGIRDREAMDRAAKRMDRMREEMRSRVGEREWAVELIRETRDEA